MRPDILLLAKGSRGAWLAVEEQFDEDPDKLLLWPFLAAVLWKTRGRMGDMGVFPILPTVTMSPGSAYS